MRRKYGADLILIFFCIAGSPSTSSAGTEVTLPSTTFSPGAVTASFSSVASSAPVGCNAPVEPDGGGVLVWRHWNSICSGNWLLCQSSEEILECLRGDCWFDPWAFGHTYTFYNALLSCDDSHAMSCGNGSSSNASEDALNAECSGLVTCQTDGTWMPSINCWKSADLIESPSTSSAGTEVTLPTVELQTIFSPGAVTAKFSSVASSAPVGCNALVKPDSGGVLVWRHWNSICSGNWFLCQSSEEILQCLREDCWFDPWAFGHSYTFYNALLSCDDSYAMSCGNGSSSNTSEDDQNAECSGLVTCQTDGTWKPSINCWSADLIGSPSTSSAGTEVTLPSELETTFSPGAVTTSFSSVAPSAPVDPSTTQQAKIGTTSSSKLSTVTETTTSSFKPPSTTEMFSSKPTEIETTTSQSTPYTTNGVTSFGNTMSTQTSVWIGRHIPLLAGIAIAVGMAIVVPLLVFVVKSKCGAASVASNAG